MLSELAKVSWINACFDLDCAESMEGFVDSLWVIRRIVTFVISFAVVGREQAVEMSFKKTNPKLL